MSVLRRSAPAILLAVLAPIVAEFLLGDFSIRQIGIALALYAFMADALHVAHHGVDAVRTVLPNTFNWSVFVVALMLMSAPVAHITWQMRVGAERSPNRARQ